MTLNTRTAHTQKAVLQAVMGCNCPFHNAHGTYIYIMKYTFETKQEALTVSYHHKIIIAIPIFVCMSFRKSLF